MFFSTTLLILFMTLMVAIGIWGMRKTETLGDFFLGGRSVGPWISAFAYGTSYYSAVMFIGFAGKLGWTFGLDVLWISLGNTLFGCLAAWFVLGYRTRRMTQNLDVMTMPEFFQERFEAPKMKVFAAVIVFIFLLPYSASVFKGLGHLFEISFDMDYNTALILMCVFTGLYLVMGGYFAVTLNDFIQGIVMIFGSIAMVWIVTAKCGGVSEAISRIQTDYSAHMPKAPPWYILPSLVFMTSFGVWGLPQMVQKFYAIKDEKQIVRAAMVTTVFSFIVVFAAYFVGATTHVFYETPAQTAAQAAAATAADDPGTGSPVKLPLPMIESNGKLTPAFDQFVPDLLKRLLPEPLMAVIVLLVLSASMSTLSSLILVASSSIAIDLYHGHANLSESTGRPLAMMRFLSALFIIISFFIAQHKFALIVTLMSISWGAVAGSRSWLRTGYGLFWKRTTRAGAAAGMVTGLCLAIYLSLHWGPRHDAGSRKPRHAGSVRRRPRGEPDHKTGKQGDR